MMVKIFLYKDDFLYEQIYNPLLDYEENLN